MKTGQPFEFENRGRRADGVYRWFHVRARPLRDAEGRIVHWYVLATDIDDRKHSEGELGKAFEEIKGLKDRLHDENVALREQIDQVFMFEEIVGSSPALKTVLSSIVKVAPTDSTVLITGETGTGKELIARAIHKGFAPRRPSFYQRKLRRDSFLAYRLRIVWPREGRLYWCPAAATRSF